MNENSFDYDYIVIGSGFGGSVSAMRLAQKGYKVAVLEAGKRFHQNDYAKTNWRVNKFLWMPKLFCYGIQRITMLRDVLVLSGAGVGGGSLVYANTLYVPLPQFFQNPTVQRMGGEKGLSPFYDVAKRMLGVETNPKLWEADELLKDTATDMGFGDSFKPTPAGVFFGEQGKTVPDPYFGGEGPDRTGCNYCGGCMVGCRFNAKNTLDKNYLYFAEKLGAEIIPETTVTRIVPLSDDGSEGYEIRTKSTTGLFGAPHKKFRTRGLVLSAGVLGTLKLLLKHHQKGWLPGLSPRLGDVVRTNSESLIGVSSLDKSHDFSRGIAITSSVYPDSDTHIEPVRYPKGSDAMNFLAAPVLVDGGGKVPRQIRFLLGILRHPIRAIRMLIPFGFAKRSVILLVMQSSDNYIRILRKRRWFWPFSKSLTSRQDHDSKIPTFIPIANEFARRMAKRMGGVARSTINEVMLDIPSTAHVLGGACISQSREEGVLDLQNRVHGYQNFIVCDGSMIPANLGVNPSLTITALSERAMSLVPPRDKHHTFAFEKNWGVEKTLTTAGPVK
ncbi:MAG: cholesterol oxidase [Spirochaetaceae bacterium]|nr:cholesterol oxidase [Spirochaetaceae bacterium]|tara:strand:- start:32266 stop:33933 length:1668 start_codon:yes stop_codon:yes gene_type:complete